MRRRFALLLLLFTPAPVAAQAGPPRTHRPAPTVPAITPGDLMTRLYIYADDSMEGREAGTPGNLRATKYIEEQVRALGLKPGGDKGGYFMYMPITAPMTDPSSTMTAGGKTFHVG